MPSLPKPRPRPSQPIHRVLLALVGVALAVGALAFAAQAASAGPGPGAVRHATGEPLVVRGEATVADAPCPGGVCIELTGGAMRGTLGAGAYTGTVKLDVARAFPNGEGGVCAPISGRLVLGTGSPDRLAIDVRGDSCQDGAGPPDAASFTGMARFKVAWGTGAYAGARGRGLASFLEDAADRDRMTLVGRIAR